MNTDQIAIARKIATHGAVVLSSYQVPYYAWGIAWDDNRVAMTSDEINVFESLYTVTPHRKTVALPQGLGWIYRFQRSSATVIVSRRPFGDDSGKWDFVEMRLPETLQFPQATSEWLEYEGPQYDYVEEIEYRHDSQWLRREQVQMDDDFEYHIGLVTRYLLTDEALQAIENEDAR